VETWRGTLDGSGFRRDGAAGVVGTRRTPCRGETRGGDGGPVVQGMVGEVGGWRRDAAVEEGPSQ
jgi:hypothetical protein